MNEEIINVNYLVDGILTVLPTKMYYEMSDENDIHKIWFEINIGEKTIISEVSDTTEFGVKNLKKSLPNNIYVVCCQSCRYGNFCPYGDNDNEIFCLKNIISYNKMDVCQFFSNNLEESKLRRRVLLDYCTCYKPISHDDYYTYNDWGI